MSITETCDMCTFLHEGKKNAKSKQASNEYAEAFYTHIVKHHPKHSQN